MVSVIIPVYNGGNYLEKCLRSVMEQSYRDLEIIVIDDGSTDNSYEICKKLAEEDSRIRLIRQDNAGVSAARNHGLSLAGGKYILFVDADDELTEAAAEQLVRAAETGADLVIGSYEAFRGNMAKTISREEIEVSDITLKAEMDFFDKLLDTPWAKLYKRETIAVNHIRFCESLPYGEDHVFNLNFCKRAHVVRITSSVVYRYRLGGIASSIKYHKNINEFNFALLNSYCEFFDGKEKVPIYFLKRKIKDQLVGSVMHYMVHCPHKEAVFKVNETLSMYKPYLNEQTVDCENYTSAMVWAILRADAQNIMKLVFQNNWFRIVMKRMKKQYVTYFKRI